MPILSGGYQKYRAICRSFRIHWRPQHLASRVRQPHAIRGEGVSEMRRLTRKSSLYGLAFLALLVALGVAQSILDKRAAAQGRAGTQGPIFEVDPLWPKPLPNHWLLGSTIGVSVDEQDHVWIIHRSSATLANNERADWN